MATSLPPEEAVARWVEGELAALDNTARVPTWRHRALGMNRAEALGQIEHWRRLRVQIPVGEWRIVADAAKRRDIKLHAYHRRALATVLVMMEGVDVAELPSLGKGGVIAPWPT